MKLFVIILLFNLLGFSSCTETDNPIDRKLCGNSVLNKDITYNDLIHGIPQNIVEGLVERPNENGALGRNRDGYFHVRFQFDITRLSDYAIKFQNEEAILEYLKSLHYSFSYQKPDGDFLFVAPDEILNDPDYQPPSDADLASGTAFFAYSVGLSLVTLNQSLWFSDSNSLKDSREDITSLQPNIQNMLNYLKSGVDLLHTIDQEAPNRLLFNAIAFYSLGKYLNDTEAKNMGIGFAEKALKQRNYSEGYFIEGGGWDSSYNGVAVKLSFELYTLLQNSQKLTIMNELEQAAICATEWQKTRILTTGEITTEGNTRVFPGGEEFLGNEKNVDVIKTAKAFFYMATLSENSEYELLAEKVIQFYE